MAIEVGKKAPEFTLEDQEGKSVSLSDFRGRDVVIYFYPRDETPGCTKEACAFRDLSAEIQQQGAVILGISPDGAESHRDFRRHHALPFPLLSDPDHRVMAHYGAFGTKTMYGRKVRGVIRSTVWIGPDGRVVKHWKRVARAADHPAQVLAALEAR
jgi:thioredoxin-dependent peroxiredoxin